MDATVTIDMDEKCRECGKDGATQSGLCLGCARKRIPGAAEPAGGERHIKSVKINRKTGQIEIVTVEKIGENTEKTWTLKSAEPPHPALPEAMNALEPHVRRLVDLPADWAKGALEVTKVTWSWSEKHGIQGAAVSCVAYLGCADAPMSFTTPHLPYERYSDGGKELPWEMREALDALEAEVIDYLNGKRGQGDLFQEAA